MIFLIMDFLKIMASILCNHRRVVTVLSRWQLLCKYWLTNLFLPKGNLPHVFWYVCLYTCIYVCVFSFPCTKAQIEYNWESKLTCEIWVSFTLRFFVDKANCYLNYLLPQVSSYHQQVQPRGPSADASCHLPLDHLVITCTLDWCPNFWIIAYHLDFCPPPRSALDHCFIVN